MANGKWTSRLAGTPVSVGALAGPRFTSILGTLVTMLFVTPSLAATPECNAAAAQLAAPRGMIVGPINDLNPKLPAPPSGALLVPAVDSAPSYCLVTGSLITNPGTGKTVNFGLALPLAWNHKFLFSGCDGYCGVVFQNPPDGTGGGYPADALAKGYAIAATDGGHANMPVGYPNDASWALLEPGVPDTDALDDYFHRAVHAVSVAGKQFVQRWYTGALTRAYFFGCSAGGREGMMEATRYPTDFDGYVVGDPFFDVPAEILSGRASKALFRAADSYVAPSLLALVDNAVYAACDDVDGVRDRLIQNPGHCSFRPESLLCRGDNGVACLTRGEVRTLNTWFSAARDREGRVVSYGFPVSDIYNGRDPGKNLFSWVASAGPPRDINARAPWGHSPQTQPNAWAFMDQAMKYLVHRDPNFDTRLEPPVNDHGIVKDRSLELLVARTDAGSSDAPTRLYPFLEANRKLIMYHGYSDGWVSPYRTIRFYRDWAKRAGGYDALGKSARLFTVPGMYHCSGGPGPNVFDALGALEQWVENGVAPEGIVATKYANDDLTQPVLRTMPLCTFPRKAEYAGEGDMNHAANWSCPANEGLLRVGPNGAAAGLIGPKR